MQGAGQMVGVGVGGGMCACESKRGAERKKGRYVRVCACMHVHISA